MCWAVNKKTESLPSYNLHSGREVDTSEQTRKIIANCNKCYKGKKQVAEIENKGQREVRHVGWGSQVRPLGEGDISMDPED